MDPALIALLISTLFEMIAKCRKDEDVSEEEVMERLRNPRLLDRIRLARRLDAPRREQRKALGWLMAHPGLNELEAREMLALAAEENEPSDS